MSIIKSKKQKQTFLLLENIDTYFSERKQREKEFQKSSILTQPFPTETNLRLNRKKRASNNTTGCLRERHLPFLSPHELTQRHSRLYTMPMRASEVLCAWKTVTCKCKSVHQWEITIRWREAKRRASPFYLTLMWKPFSMFFFFGK